MSTIIIVYILTGLVGLCVGSFLNVVIYRLPNNMSLAFPPSHCTECDYKLKWYDNIPVISYILLKGKCRNCKTHISFRYTFVEILNTVLWLLCVMQFGINDRNGIICSAVSAITCSICICIAFIDLENKIIFDRFQIMLAVLGIAFTVADKDTSLLSHLIGAVAGGVIFFAIGFFVSRKVGKEALGGGDIKFAVVSGLFLGWGKLILMMLFSSVSACIVLMALQKKSNNEKDTEYPFGPFLCAGFIVTLLFGTLIINTYFHILGLE
ncbi:MAG: prepilin peptidase [Clostridia bacterium]|nr:prepilin peptidase [Clostridia bacterium]